MADDLIFYTNPMSRGRMVRWMLEEVGAPYETRILSYGADMKSAEFLTVNPMGKVPAIVHGGAVVTEVAAICAYLAETFPDAGLAPRSAKERASYYRWMFFAAGPLEAAVTNRVLGVVVPDEKRGFVGYGSYQSVLDALEGAVSASSFIAGDRFTAADVYVGSHLSWGLQFGSIERREAFEAYVERVKARPALHRATEIDDALLASTKG
ncbi:glutathione S-transferase [Aureimonas ureilytica]|uniref:Glutathione S-transferase n=1 Tax=Aureimonas ureilytica TaxID=401562 RepID=A0A175R501_9HYPH|nr:glutathione S-transferase family protein [Aureimonas ureilytica]KTQ86970.1 glutathione S-transferase [Aureimonas ureilytica]